MLDQVVHLSDVREVSQPNGSLTIEKTNRVRAFAKVRPLSGRERYAGGQVRAPAMYRFTLRNREMSESQVIEWRGDVYNIRFIGTSGTRDRYIHVDAEKDVPE